MSRPIAKIMREPKKGALLRFVRQTRPLPYPVKVEEDGNFAIPLYKSIHLDDDEPDGWVVCEKDVLFFISFPDLHFDDLQDARWIKVLHGEKIGYVWLGHLKRIYEKKTEHDPGTLIMEAIDPIEVKKRGGFQVVP